jgi:hypothetical protein
MRCLFLENFQEIIKAEILEEIKKIVQYALFYMNYA